MQRPKPVLLVVLLVGATALSAPSPAGAASGAQTFRGTIITDAAGGERHIVKSVVIAHGAFNGVGTIVEVPNQPGDGEDIFRDDLVFAQGTLHLVTTNLGFAFNVIAQSCRSPRLCSRRARSSAGPACSRRRPGAEPAGWSPTGRRLGQRTGAATRSRRPCTKSTGSVRRAPCPTDPRRAIR